MPTFLTTQQMQELINVDRSTVYRMAEDGRLPAIKVGRQWRFPADRVAELFGLPGQPAASPPASGRGASSTRPSLDQLLVPDAAQSVADLLGDLFGIMAVVTDMDGRPLTTVANQCGFYATIASRPGAAEACLEGWRQLAAEPHVAPRFVPSHLGFLCARTFIWVDLQPVGMIVVGGVTPSTWPPPPEHLAAVAAETGVSATRLAEAVPDTFDVPAERQRWILRMLPQVGDLISQLASARCQLLARLDAIAALASPTPPQGRE